MESRREWQEDTAPGTSDIKLMAITIQKRDGSPVTIANVTDDLEVTLTYRVYKPFLNIPLRLWFSTCGTIAFASPEPSEHIHECAGTYASSVVIPANLLSENEYTVSVSIFSSRGVKMHYVKALNILSFQVVDPILGDSARGDYAEGLAGVLRPLLVWKIDKMYSRWSRLQMTRRLEITPDTELLDLMLQDYAEVEPRWQATSYWREFAGPMVEYFHDPENVKHFRSAPVRTGIRSVNPANEFQRPRLRGHGPKLLAALNHMPILKGLMRYFEETQDMLIKSHESTFRHAQILSWLYLNELGKGQAVLDDMRVGDPDDGVEIEGNYYSYRSMGYQQLYLQAARYVDMRSIRSVIELGSGYGGQIEVFLRKNANTFCLAVDILPWLYIAEIYLKAVFPGQVMGYRETRNIDAKIDLLERI